MVLLGLALPLIFVVRIGLNCPIAFGRGETSPLHLLTESPRSPGLWLQSVYRLFQANAGILLICLMNFFTVQLNN